MGEDRAGRLQGKYVCFFRNCCCFFFTEVKLALVPGTGFGEPDYVRWSYATSMKNIDEGISRLKKFISKLNH